MTATIMGVRPSYERTGTQHCCGRCGIEYEPGHTVHPERAVYCKDCRVPAALLGWCPPKERRKAPAKA